MKCVCPSGGNRTCPDDCLLAVWHRLPVEDRKARRKPIAEQLYKQGYTMEAIATQLGVSKATISNDLVDCLPIKQSKDEKKTAMNPKGSGRPKGRAERKSDSAKKARAASLFLDEGLSRDQVQYATGMSAGAVQAAVERERGRREAEPIITPEMLSMSAQQKLDAAVRQHKRQLDIVFEKRVLDEIAKRINEMILPSWKKRIDQAQELFRHRRGAMDKATFNKIRRALHPDSRKSISDEALAEAFDTFMSLEKFLLDEKDSPTDVGSDLPKSWEEWERAKREAAALRRAGRTGIRRVV